MTKILMTYSNTEGLERLLNHPEFKVDIQPKPSPEKLLQLIPAYDGLLIRSEVKVTKEVIDKAPALKLIVRAGTGVDNIDTTTATQKGIAVANIPGGNTISATEHTIALLLALSRNIPQAHYSIKSGLWEKEKFTGTELQGKVLGLIGLGRIGKEVAKRALSFGMRVIAYDPYVTDEYGKSIGVELKQNLDEIYAQSDYISLHTPLNESTRHLINKDSISKLKTGCRIINCARGGIIDEEALCDGIKSGKIHSAALDVFEKEPLSKDSPLLELQNVLLTPHLGASTEEAQIKIAQEASELIIDFFTKGIIRNAVNIPQVDMETFKNIRPYLDLVEKIGLFQGQIVEGRIKEIELVYAGEISNMNLSLVTPSYLKGLLTPILDIKVNFVNANYVAQERGIKVKESRVSFSEDYTSLIKALVFTDITELDISGTVFAHQLPRIVNIKNLDVDIVPEGCMLFLENIDKPGVIGKIGTILGNNKINIASMQVGRKEVSKEAITIINIDNIPDDETIKEIEKIDGVTKVKLVKI
ncbi:MAG: phosphoglycerate dehydrogenase [Elusimicrobiota bacterium]|nr:phosphoglycerate dehydrogenase [Elusimicrobiota bacterium]